MIFTYIKLFSKIVIQPDYSYQQCETPSGHLGRCRFLQHCAKPEMLTSIETFLTYACPIGQEWVTLNNDQQKMSSFTL